MKIGIACSIKEIRKQELLKDEQWLLPEYDSIETVNSIRAALSQREHEVSILGDEIQFLDKIMKQSYDFIFNIAEGTRSRSRETHVPSILEVLKVPYSHSDPSTLLVCQNKLLTALYLRHHNISCPRSQVVDRENYSLIKQSNISFPVIVKPLYEGSSIGIEDSSVTQNLNQLRKQIDIIFDTFNQAALIEEYCDGPEYTAAVLGNGSEAKCIGLASLELLGKNQLVCGKTDKINMDSIALTSVPSSKTLERLAIRTHLCLGCRDISRIDIRLKNDSPMIIDVNPLPGLDSKTSFLPIIAKNYVHTDLINAIFAVAIRRYPFLGAQD